MSDNLCSRCGDERPIYWRSAGHMCRRCAAAIGTAAARTRLRPSPTERLHSKIDKTGAGGCWLWVGSLRRNGYGQMYLNGQMTEAHRAAYLLLVGPIPTGLQLDHLCRVRRCVNPTHLEPVTPAVNTQRAREAKAMSA